MEYKIITSKDNQQLKIAKSLQDKKGRQKYNQLLVEGKKFIADLLKYNIKLNTIFFSKDSLDFVETLSLPNSVQLIMLENNLICELSRQTTSQQVIAIIDTPSYSLEEPTTNFLVLDGLQDAGNVGTILRTALATDYKTIYLIDCVDVFSPKVIDASMTAIFHLNLVKITRKDFIKLADSHHFDLICADLTGENALHYSNDCDIIGLVIGNEGNGVSMEISAICQTKLTIPMANNIESLNAGVSAGILMYLLKKNKGE